MASIDHIVATVVSFLRAAAFCFLTDIDDQASCATTVVKLCLIFLNCLSSKLAAREHKLTAICLYAEQLKGLLHLSTKHSQMKCPLDGTEDGEGAVEPDEEIVQYVLLLLFSITLILKLPESWNVVEEEEKEDDSKEGATREICWLSSSDIHLLKDHLLTAIYSIALWESFTRHYKSVSLTAKN
jgi:hypothetical protein